MVSEAKDTCLDCYGLLESIHQAFRRGKLDPGNGGGGGGDDVVEVYGEARWPAVHAKASSLDPARHPRNSEVLPFVTRD